MCFHYFSTLMSEGNHFDVCVVRNLVRNVLPVHKCSSTKKVPMLCLDEKGSIKLLLVMYSVVQT